MLPLNGGRGLRILVHDFAVGTLAADEELELFTCERKVAVSVDGVERVERIASKEPAKAWPGRIAGFGIASHQRRLLTVRFVVNLRFQLLNGNDRPLERFVERWVGRLDGDRAC